MITCDCLKLGVSDEIARQGHWIRLHDNEWLCSDPVAVQAIIDSFDHVARARKDAKLRIIEQINAAAMSIEKAYPEAEKKTWPYQRAEIEAWRKDAAAPTPTIDAIASIIGVTREEQLASVASKVDQYANFSNFLTGERQRIFALIDASVDDAEIDGINFGGG